MMSVDNSALYGRSRRHSNSDPAKEKVLKTAGPAALSRPPSRNNFLSVFLCLHRRSCARADARSEVLFSRFLILAKFTGLSMKRELTRVVETGG